MADDRLNIDTMGGARAIYTAPGHHNGLQGIEGYIMRPAPTYKVDFDRVNNMAEIVGLLRAFFGDTYMTRKKAEEFGIDHLLDI